MRDGEERGGGEDLCDEGWGEGVLNRDLEKSSEIDGGCHGEFVLELEEEG